MSATNTPAGVTTETKSSTSSNANDTTTKARTVISVEAGKGPEDEKKKLSSDFDQDPMLENPALRMTAYAARITRLLATTFAKGVRYTAYTSDVGEAFRPVVPLTWVRVGYAVSWTYVLTDVGLQTKWAMDKKQDYVRAGLHAAVFQTFGSMLLPSLVVHTVVHQSEKVFNRVGLKNRWFPTGLGLAVVPFLPYICDQPVEYATDMAFDHFWPVKEEHHHKKH